MKLAILSDIHSNLEALEEVLKTIEQRQVDAVYCLGDLVGYGADAVACVELVRQHCKGVVLGNHDLAVAREEWLKILPKDAQAAATHNRKQLSGEQNTYLATLPLKLETDGCTFVHASPQDPGSWKRLGSFLTAQDQFNHYQTAICFIGHSHVPAVLSNRLGTVRIQPGLRYLINVGSVGQPRDGDPRACVAFFDTETYEYELVRVPYHIEAAAAKIIGSGLPRRLAERLFRGI